MGVRNEMESLSGFTWNRCPECSGICNSVVVETKEEQQVKIVFVRNHNKKRQWLGIVSTDTELSNEKIVRIYGKRWDIEVFFKMMIHYLILGKGNTTARL